MLRIVSADSSHRARKEAAHIAERGGCVCGEPLIFYIIVKGNNTKYMPVVHASQKSGERERRERTITRAKKRTHAFVLQALTSNIRRDNKCSAALCAARRARHLIYAPQLGGPLPHSLIDARSTRVMI